MLFRTQSINQSINTASQLGPLTFSRFEHKKGSVTSRKGPAAVPPGVLVPKRSVWTHDWVSALGYASELSEVGLSPPSLLKSAQQGVEDREIRESIMYFG